MVIVNGYVQAIELNGGGYDATGAPIAPVSLAGELIPCNISSLRHTKANEVQDTKYQDFGATLLIDLRDFNAERVNVFDLRGNLLRGNIRVQDVQTLEFVNAVQIKV